MKKFCFIFLLFTRVICFGQDPGNLDFNWRQVFIDAGATGQVLSICVQDDGGMLVGGIFRTSSATGHSDVENLIRLTSAGFIDKNFFRKTSINPIYF
jgi:hypothetical protein